jgi:hypothetical protein
MNSRIIDALVKFGIITSIGIDASKYDSVDDLINKGVVTIPGIKDRIIDILKDVEIEDSVSETTPEPVKEEKTIEPITETIEPQPVIETEPVSVVETEPVVEIEPVVEPQPVKKKKQQKTEE